MYYTVIKHFRHLRTLEKCRKHLPAACVFHFPSCSQMPVVFYHSVIHGLGSPPLPPPHFPPPFLKQQLLSDNNERLRIFNHTDCAICLMIVCGRGSWLMFCGRTIFFRRSLQHSWRAYGTKRELKKFSCKRHFIYRIFPCISRPFKT